MKENEFITVYWSPANFVKNEESWTHLYQEPKSLISNLTDIRDKNTPSTILSCPAHLDLIKNVYSFNSALDHTINLPDQNIGDGFDFPRKYYSETNLLSIIENRMPSFDGYRNLTVNMAWLFFADEPLIARFTAPYFPAVSPGQNVILSSGEFDIGSWYRKYELDYHVPNNLMSLSFKENEPMFFIEFKTDKKIIFKRYIQTEHLRQLSLESANSPKRYGSRKPLSARYSAFRNAGVAKQVLSEIKNNLID